MITTSIKATTTVEIFFSLYSKLVFLSQKLISILWCDNNTKSLVYAMAFGILFRLMLNRTVHANQIQFFSDYYTFTSIYNVSELWWWTRSRALNVKTFSYILRVVWYWWWPIIYFNSFHRNDAHQSLLCVPSIENPLSLGFLWLWFLFWIFTL